MDFRQASESVGIPPECTKCEKYLPPDWVEFICSNCEINESAAEAMKQYEDEQKKIVEEQVHHRLSNNKWAKENDRKIMKKLRYEIKAAEAKLALENRLRQNPRVPQSTTGAPATPENRRFDFPRSSGPPGSFASSRDRSVPLTSMRAGVYSTISNSLAPGNVASHFARKRLTREESVEPGNKVSRTGRIRQVGFLMEDQIPQHSLGSMEPPPPRLPQNSGSKHKANVPTYVHSDDDDDDLLETRYRSVNHRARSRQQTAMSRRQDRHHDDAGSYHKLINTSRDYRPPQPTQGRHSLYQATTSRQSRTPADQPDAHDDADMAGLSLEDEYPPTITRSAPRPQFNRMGSLVDTDAEYVLYSSHTKLALTLQQSVFPSFLQTLTSRRSTTEPEMARNLRPRNRSRTSHPMTSVTSKRTGDSISARARKLKRQKVNEQPEPALRQPGRLHFNSSSASAFHHIDEASAPHKSAPYSKKAWAVPKDVVARAKLSIHGSGVDRLSAPNGFADAPDAVSDDDSALLNGYDSDTHSQSHMSQVTVPLTEKMSMWHVKPAISDSALALQVEKQMKTMPSFVISEASASDAEKSNMLKAWEIALAKNKLVQKKMKITQIAVFRPSHAPGGSVAGSPVAKSSTEFDDEDSDDDDDDVEHARFDGGDAQMEALNLLRELPQKLKGGTLEPSVPPPRPPMSRAVAKHYTPRSDDAETLNVVCKMFSVPKKATEKTQKMLAPNDSDRPSEVQQSFHNIDEKIRGIGSAKNANEEENH